MNEEIGQVAKVARDPSSYAVATYTWVLIATVFGAGVRIYREGQLGNKNWKQVAGTIVGEILVSIFVGVVTFFLCESQHVDQLYTATMTSIAGYMGGKALAPIEWLWYRFVGAKQP